MTLATPGKDKGTRSPAAQKVTEEPKPAKKAAGGKVSAAAPTFSIKSPRNNG